MNTKDDGGPAFPGLHPSAECRYNDPGMTLRDYFIAHAPAEPQFWFEPVMNTPEPPKPIKKVVRRGLDGGEWYDNDAHAEWRKEKGKQTYVQWPAAWADAMLAARETKP